MGLLQLNFSSERFTDRLIIYQKEVQDKALEYFEIGILIKAQSRVNLLVDLQITFLIELRIYDLGLRVTLQVLGSLGGQTSIYYFDHLG